MAGPMSTADIEDVLSSIRRLVSEEFRPASRTALRQAPRPDVPMEGVEATEPPGKLLLTPALRIVRDTEPLVLGAQTGEAAETKPEPEAQAGVKTATAQDTASAGVTALVSAIAAGVGQKSDWEDETGDRLDLGDMQDAQPWPSDAAEFDAAEPLSVKSPMAEPLAEVVAKAKAEALATTEATAPAEPVAKAVNAPDPITAPTEAVAEPVTTAKPVAQSVASAEQVSEEAPADAWEEAPRDWQDPVATQPEPATGAYVSAKDPWADERMSGEHVSEVAAPAPELDLETLRGIVRDVLREELSGATGERITRNVRKLVRAEILRAVTSQDLLEG